MNTGPLPPIDNERIMPWWHYPEKDAWYDFEREHPDAAEAIGKVVALRDLSDSPDPVLSSGVQVQGLCLRVAELLGFVKLDRLTGADPARYGQRTDRATLERIRKALQAKARLVHHDGDNLDDLVVTLVADCWLMMSEGFPVEQYEADT
jgi:hypothetical protein